MWDKFLSYYCIQLNLKIFHQDTVIKKATFYEWELKPKFTLLLRAVLGIAKLEYLYIYRHDRGNEPCGLQRVFFFAGCWLKRPVNSN